MKKIISVILCIAMLIATCAFAAAAYVKEGSEISDYPVVIVPGYSSSTFYIGDDFESGEKIWGLDMDLVLERVIARIADLGIGLGAMTVGNAEIIAKTLGEEISGIFEKLRCNPDGTSAYDVKRKYVTAEESNSKYMLEHLNDTDDRHEKEIAAVIEEYVVLLRAATTSRRKAIAILKPFCRVYREHCCRQRRG